MIFYSDNYYSTPYQVLFMRPDDDSVCYDKGIVFHSHVISARDGKAFSVKKIMRHARNHGINSDYAIVERFEWKELEIE